MAGTLCIARDDRDTNGAVAVLSSLSSGEVGRLEGHLRCGVYGRPITLSQAAGMETAPVHPDFRAFERLDRLRALSPDTSESVP